LAIGLLIFGAEERAIAKYYNILIPCSSAAPLVFASLIPASSALRRFVKKIKRNYNIQKIMTNMAKTIKVMF